VWLRDATVKWHTPCVSRGYHQFCGLARALDLIGGRWALLIIRDLLTGPKRFSELQEGLPGVPTNVLTARLRELEDEGIVLRRAHERPGGGVVYDLTDFGRELEQPIMRLGFWGAKAMGPMNADDHFSIDSLALGLRGSFRPEQAEQRPRLYEFKVEGQSLRALVASEQPDGQGQRVPDPPVSSAGGTNHPQPNPLRCAPMVYAAHQAMVPRGDEGEHGLGGRHVLPPLPLYRRQMSKGFHD